MPFEKGDSAIHEHVDEVMGRFHAGLRDAKVRVDCVWARAKTDDNGDPVGAALKLHGYPCAAVVRVLSQKDRAMGRGDAEITFDADKWDERPPAEKDAIIDHELLHLELVVGGDGEIKRDDGGRPRLKLKLHDIEVGWFLAVAERHGQASLEVQQAEQIYVKNEQLLFPFAARSPAMKAKEFFDADASVKSVLADAAEKRGVALSGEDLDGLAECIAEGMKGKGIDVKVSRGRRGGGNQLPEMSRAELAEVL